MSDSALSFQPCKQIAARRLSEDILHCIPTGELRKGGRGKKWMGQAVGKIKRKKTNTPCFRIQLRKMFRRKQREHADSFICSYWHIQNSSGAAKKRGSLQAGLSLCTTLSHNAIGINLCLQKSNIWQRRALRPWGCQIKGHSEKKSTCILV